MCKMIDEMAVLPREDAGQNTVIYETCAYMHQVFLPTVLNHNITFFQNTTLQKALIDFLDIVSIRYEREDSQKVALLQTKDQEEFLYREVMLTQVVNLSLILLKYTPGGEHTVIYELFQDLLKKTAH